MQLSKRKEEKDKTAKKVFKINCLRCKTHTKHLVKASFDVSDKVPLDEEYWADIEEHYQIVQCQGCETVSFRHEYWDSEMFEDTLEYLYPQRLDDTIEQKRFSAVPENLEAIYKEVISSYNTGNHILCAAGIRTLIEGICNELGIKEGNVEVQTKNGVEVKVKDNLEGKINGLYENGHLTKRNAAILHEMRFLGNTALHKLAKPDKDQLTTAIEITEHTLTSIYEIHKKADRLKRKRLKNSPSIIQTNNKSESKQQENQDTINFRMDINNLKAEGYLSETGFFVKKGSYANLKVHSSFLGMKGANITRQNLLADGTLIEDNDKLMFTKDYKFPSFSQAGCVIAGGSIAAVDYWRNSDGRSVNDLRKMGVKI